MKKRLNVILAMVMAVMCCLTMFTPAFAAELPEVTIPATVSLTGTRPYPAEAFTVVMKADDASNPMPAGAEGGVYNLTVTGAATENFPAIVFDKVGVYSYTIYQAEGTNSRCTYDKTVYELTVTVTNKADYSGIEATVVLYEGGEGSKLAGVDFANRYPTERTPEPEITVMTVSGKKTWMDDGREHNNAEEVKLLLTRSIDGVTFKVVPGVEPIWYGNNYYFYDLDIKDENGNKYEYAIKEKPVAGYEASYDGFNITNRLTYEVLEVEVSGVKTWNDEENAAGTRPESIVVQLERDGEVIDTVTVSEETGWAYSFTNLPDNDGYGLYYTYTVSEQAVPGYWVEVDGYNLINNKVPDSSAWSYRELTEEELEGLIDIFDYGVPLWGGLLQTGDLTPLYPVLLGIAGVGAMIALIIVNRKKRKAN